MVSSLSKIDHPNLCDADFARFCDLARTQTGLEFMGARRAELERAVILTLAETGLSDAGALWTAVADLDANHPLRVLWISKLIVGETHFFRNQPQFEALERHILPALIDRRRGEHRLRLWSAGCSTGEEPYSLAILLRRLLPDWEDWDITLLATDVNVQALDKARHGIYGAWSFRQVAPEIKQQYFVAQGAQWSLIPQIRRLVTFAYLNLVDSAYPSVMNNVHSFDLILCRNVLIYFSAATIDQVVHKLHDTLGDEGWLVVGHTEPSQSTFRRFTPHNFPGAVIYRKPAMLQQQLPRSIPEIADFGPVDTPMTAPPRVAIQPVTPAPAAVEAGTMTANPSHTKVLPVPDSATTLALCKAGQEEEALRRLEAQVASSTDSGYAAYLAAKVQAGRHKLPEAERWVQIALERAPLLAPAHCLHGLLLQEAGQPDAALAALRRCIYADADCVLGHYMLAGLYARLSQHRRAAKEYATVSELLHGHAGNELVPDGDGISTGHLLELVSLQSSALKNADMKTRQ